MKKKKTVKAATSKKKSLTKVLKGEEVKLEFRERRLRDINLSPKHPKPVPHLPTLPGPPGWQVKLNPLNGLD